MASQRIQAVVPSEYTSSVKRRKSDNKIPLVVVESHHHCLEHYHEILRRRRLLTQGPWSLLHWDSHPDLACPHRGIPAKACYQPRRTSHDDDNGETTNNEKDLYEMLDSTVSGIAEWILPLVLAANLKQVLWIRPSFPSLFTIEPRQFPSGRHKFQAGAWVPSLHQKDQIIDSFLDLPEDACVKVDWKCRYYQSDNSYAPTNELLFPQPLELCVEQGSSSLGISNPSYAVDICLDYFACGNPFVTDLETVDPYFTAALIELEQQSVFYSKQEQESHNDFEQLQSFRLQIAELLQQWADPDAPVCNEGVITAAKHLSQYFTSVNQCQNLAKILKKAFLSSTADLQALVQLTVEALPYLDMPHFRPSSLTDEQVTAAALDGIQHRLSLETLDPWLISISRSANDGFTPTSRVEDLQQRTLLTIHDRYCTCSHPPTQPGQTSGNQDCRLMILFDYGEWEGGSFADLL